MRPQQVEFENWIKEYTPMIYNLAYRLLGNSEDSIDVVQDTFLKVYKNRERISPEKNLKNWLYTIGINTARDKIRQKKRKNEVSGDDSLHFVGKDNLEYSIDNKLLLEKLIGGLPMDLREAVVLFYFEEKTVMECAEILNITESLVKTRLFRARKQMLIEFEGLSDEL